MEHASNNSNSDRPNSGRPGGQRGGRGPARDGRPGGRGGSGARRDGKPGGRGSFGGGRRDDRGPRRDGKPGGRRDGERDFRKGGSGDRRNFDRRDRDDRGPRRDGERRGYDRDRRDDRRDGERRGYDRGGRDGRRDFDRRDGERRGFDRGGRDDRRGGERRDDRRSFDRGGRDERRGNRQDFGRKGGFGDRDRSGGPRKEGSKKRAPLADEVVYDAEIDEWINDGNLLEFFASCPQGLEHALGEELKQCGLERTRPLRGGVAFYGTVRDAYVACLWSRLASRVFYVVGRCPAGNENELYEGVKAMAWSRQIPVDKTISVYAHGTNANLRNTQFTALRAKDALCDALRAGRGKRPDVNLSKPDVLIDVNVRGPKATISIDLVGVTLHNRSYERAGVGGDGFKSAIAACVLDAAWWSRAAKEGKPFIDPLCRDGYLVTEAAMMAADMAPGLARSRWGFSGWNGHDEDVWNEVVDEAENRLEAALEHMAPIYALAMDEKVAANVESMLKRAGLAQYVKIVDAQDERAVARVLKTLDSTLAGLEAAEKARVEAEEAAAAALAAAKASEQERTEAAGVRQSVRASSRAGAVAVFAVSPRLQEELDAAKAEEAALETAEPTDVEAEPAALVESVEDEGAATDVADAEVPADAETETAPADADAAAKPAAPAAAERPNYSVRGVAATVMPLGQDEADALGLDTYRKLTSALTSLPRSWKYVIVSDDNAIERFISTRPVVRPDTIRFGKVAAIVRRYSHVEAAERCDVTVFDAAANLERTIPVLEQTSEQFAARLKKNAKERRKWAEKNYVNCYRVYDADLPDYAVAIDLYHGAEESRGKTFMVVAEYQAPSEIDPQRADRRMRDILTLAPIVLGVDADKVFKRVRQQSRGGGQYRNMETRSCKATVEENGCMFEVDFGTYLDTGLFLDHRLTRERLAKLAVGKSFVNLFAYTGTATVHAAVNGAKSTLTVDLSQTYIDWAERNMLKNGFEGREHRYLRSDCVTWVRNERRTGRHHDLFFVDPPTFSNSKSMGAETWSVQRDHVELLEGVVDLLSKGGVAIFSCNLRTFKPDVEELEARGAIIADVTEETVPHDFERNQRIHHCYVLARKGDEEALEYARKVMAGEE